MREEFDALNAPFAERGADGDEQLEILSKLWSEKHISHHGDLYHFDDIAFEPKPFGRPRIPIWVGGEGVRARRRAARYGDAWFPYYVQMTPEELQARFDAVRRFAKEFGRDPEALSLSCCLPIEFADGERSEPDTLKGTADQLIEKIGAYKKVGVETLALQFMVSKWPERIEQIERFGVEVIPHLQ
jgi:alkanesulfonate monooxygenase SsuD/methylene tetrahydromethanopterin reductase-like flavin-dependent oxidoreductase (luciferase family)